MANNCLVTKLKGVVDKEGLPIIDKILIKVNVGESVGHYGLIYKNGYIPTFNADGNCFFTDINGNIIGDGKTYSFERPDGDIYFKGNGYIYLPNKTMINNAYLNCPGTSFDIRDFLYVDSEDSGLIMTYANDIGSKPYGDISNYSIRYKTIMIPEAPNIVGSLEKTIKTNKNISSLVIINSDNIHVDLDWLDFTMDFTTLQVSRNTVGHFDNIGKTNCNNFFCISPVNINGTVEGFVNNKLQRYPGVSGSLKLYSPNLYSNTYYQNKSLSQCIIEGIIPTPISGFTTLSWNSQGVVTWD